MTQSPWSVLGVRPDAAEADVRRAYAALLKQTNPEDDPEGFKRLRAAYEHATHIIRWRDRAAAPPEGAPTHDTPADETSTLASSEAAGERRREAPGVEHAPQAVDPEIAAHIDARARLEAAVEKDDFGAAWRNLVDGPAMQNLAVRASTEFWVADLLVRRRVGGEPLARAIAEFGWDNRVSVGHGDLGAQMLAFRESLGKQAEADAFLARVRDRRHEFHPAWRALTQAPAAHSAAARALSYLKVDLVDRFLTYIDDKFPAAVLALDGEAVEAWRYRADAWRRPLIIARTSLTFAVVAAVVFAAFMIPDPEENARKIADIATARRLCTEAADGAGYNSAPCDRALEFAPDSLLMRRYAGIIALRDGRTEEAAAHFIKIIAKSPHDAAARYGLGRAFSKSRNSVEFDQATDTMQRALGIDDSIQRYFADRHIVAYDHLRPLPPDTEFKLATAALGDVVRKTSISDELIAEGYRHFGMTEPFEDGRVDLRCKTGGGNRFYACRIRKESPLHTGRGELALWIANRATYERANPDGDPSYGDFLDLPIAFAATEAPSGG